MSNNKKTILYLITQSELGGAQCYVYDLATSLKDEFNIIVAGGEQGEKGKIAIKLQQTGIKFYAIPHLKRSISPINDFLALIGIIRLINKLKPDIIHLNSSKISILGSIAAIIAKSRIENRESKIVYTAHGWVFNEPLQTWKKLFYKYAEKFTSFFKDKIICVSEFDRQVALKEKICNPKKLITIHNGIKPINFLSKEMSRQKFPLLSKGGQGGVWIGSIGNLYPTKGFEYLIEAARILITNYKLQITTVIIGEGQERKNLEKLIKQNSLQNNIILAGNISDAAKLLKAFDIYVCSSVKEGLSYTIIEAMQAGLPIVATDVGGNPELIEDQKTGLLVKSQNPEKIAEKIIELINNPELGIKLGEQAKIKALEEFSLGKTVEETKKVYQG
ncbi:MAG: glycosyltransferase family 4 protein [Patescibacteria group bacterium]